MQLEWSPRAQRDLQAIHDYIALDSPMRAWKFIQRLGTVVLSLQTFPLMGRPVPEVIDNADIILELIFRNYRIIYRVIPDESIQIITVLHASRDLHNLQNQPWLTT
ncbi:MAG TPA: type II toxin-antitoxin system RelE/ParE family toxin [Pseudomonadales bacterium]|jgi:plasmid stabilization system protein ParE|nr:type II toxin-antitoxin system RelE/ParE family toxin [Pseudomonadales bacterium]HNL92321.1 type II toxin-antitoxin system RelE/ParE family toxin [Pseudomonadales bacterium]